MYYIVSLLLLQLGQVDTYIEPVNVTGDNNGKNKIKYGAERIKHKFESFKKDEKL